MYHHDIEAWYKGHPKEGRYQSTSDNSRSYGDLTLGSGAGSKHQRHYTYQKGYRSHNDWAKTDFGYHSR